jgi:EAL domain-containing protein (putative c-di-GMP-specific phosphodiesterase class I)
MELVAEGVETLRQHLVLRQLGVTQAQGYFYGKPQKHAVLSEAHLRVAAG